MICSAVCLLLLSQASSLALIAGEWVALQLSVALVQAALLAILPDQVPVGQRATVSAIATGFGTLVGGLLGQILIGLTATVRLGYLALAIAVILLLGAFLLVLREPSLSKEQVHRRERMNLSEWFAPFASHDFRLVWLARGLIFLGYTTTINYLFYFLRDAVGVTAPAQGAQIFFAITVGTTLLTSLIGGIISDKLQRRKIFVIVSACLVTVALFFYGFVPTWNVVMVAAGVLGIGMGLFFAVDTALVSQLLPDAFSRGKDSGLINTAIYLPMLLAPLIAGIALSVLHSYTLLFVLLAIGVGGAAVLVTRIRPI